MDQEQAETDKIQRAARAAAELITQEAANAKAVITATAASAIGTLTTAAAVQSKDIEYIRANLAAINDKLDTFDSKFVTHDQFSLVKNLVYGFVSLTLMSVVGGLIAMVVKR